MPPKPACIHRVGRGDELLLRDVRLRALADAPGVFAGTLAEEELYPLSHWTGLVADNQRVVFAAAARRRWVGMAGGRWSDREQGVAQLWGVWVEPPVRGRGVALRLLSEVEAWARRGGARLLRLGVIEGEAERFYFRLGFERTGERKPLSRDQSLTAVFLARPVASSSSS